jgi:hypothetical protein
MQNTILKALVLAAMVTFAASGLSGCEKKDGPAEELGEEIDDAIDNAKDAVD